MKKSTNNWIVNRGRWILFLGIAVLFTVSQSFDGYAPQEPTFVLIHTQFGDMKVKLYDDTPIHRDNFLKLVKEGMYDSTLFHRVIKGFMIQGGDPKSKGATKTQRLGTGGPGYTLEAEILPSHVHKKGVLSAARQGDRVNPERRSSGSQFYIVQGKTYSKANMDAMNKRKLQMDSASAYTEQQIKDYIEVGGTPHLDGAYTVFGEVMEGLAIIDSIANVATAPGDRPIEDVIINMEIVNE